MSPAAGTEIQAPASLPPHGTRAKPLRVQLGPLHDIRRVIKACSCLRGAEKLVFIALRILADNGTLRTDRVSVAEIAEWCGCSKRSVQRALAVLAAAGLVTVHRSRSADGKQNERNAYEVHAEALIGWVDRDRPNSWDPQRKIPRGGSDTTPPLAAPPAAYAAAVERARAELALPPHHPQAAKLGRVAERLDDRAANLARAEAELAARREKLAADIARLEAELAQLGPVAPAPTAPALPASSPAPTASTSLPAIAAVEAPEADQDDAPRQAEVAGPSLGEGELVDDRDVLFVLRLYPPLAEIATTADAGLVGESARKRFRPLVQVEVALERLAFKLRRGDYPNAKRLDVLKLARAFVRDQLPTVHAPLPNILDAIPPPPAPPDPTQADLADMRARFGLTQEHVDARRAEHVVERERRDGITRALERVRAPAPAVYAQWFGGVQLVGLVAGVLSLRACNAFVLDWVKLNYGARLEAAVRAELGERVELAWSIGEVDAPLGAGVVPSPARRSRR